MAVSAGVFALAAPASVVYHTTARLPGFDDLGGFYLAFGSQLILFFIAFFSGGLCISIALFRYASQIATVYAFDLVGASLGAVLVVPLMYQWSPMALVFIVSAIAFLASLVFVRSLSSRSWVHISLLTAIAASVAVGLLNDRLKLVGINSVKSHETQKKSPQSLYEKWSPVSRVTVERSRPTWAFRGGKPILMATNDAGAPTVLFEFKGNLEATRQMLERDSTLSGFAFQTDAKVLIIGVGGGRDVLMALATRQREITAVEINPLMGEIVTDTFADHIGRIFDAPQVTLHIQEGRNFVAASDELYDLIELSMIDSWSNAAAAGAYVFNENSLYTLEAIGDFVDHLELGGILAMTRYFEWDEALRLVAMFSTYLGSVGVSDADQRIMVIRNSLRHPNCTVLLKNGGFTKEEASRLAEIAQRGGSTIIHAPHLPEQMLASPEMRRPFETLLNPEKFATTRERFIAEYARDISPPTDDRPFFFYMQRSFDMLKIDKSEHAARRLALPLLYGMLAVFAGIAAITIFVPLYLTSRQELRRAPHRLRSLGYFAMLGTGFMLIEIAFIQRLTIFLGHPTWSFVVVLATTLFSSGLGSQFSARWASPAPLQLSRILSGTVLLLFFYALVLFDQASNYMWLGRASRVAVAVAAIAPAAFLMGMCFPMGIQIVRRFHETLVPWGWGVNGAFSVFASVLSIALALSVGFRAAMLVGVACYAIAFLLVRALPSEEASTATSAAQA